MKVHQYNEMMRYLTRRGPSNKQLAAMPLYEQGGRVGYKPGGIVEPGVTHYATITKTELTQLRKAGLEIPEIAKKFRVSTGTISNKLREYDLLGTFKRVKPMSKRKIAEIKKTLPKGLNITWDKGYGWRVTAKIVKDKKIVFQKGYLNFDEKLIKQLGNEYKAQYKKYYPNALSDAEFKNLRFKKEYKNLTSKEFAKVLNKKGYKNFRDQTFTVKAVRGFQEKLDISDEVGKQIKPLTKTQQGTLINAFPEYAGQWDFKANKYGLNFSEVGGEVWTMLRHTADDTKRWPTGGTAKSRLWHNAYRSAIKGGDEGRFRILHPMDGEIMSRDEILKYNWTKGSNKVEFLDTKTNKTFNYDGFENWMNNDAVPGQADANRFKNAANQYDLNKKLKQTKVGDETLGNLFDKKFKSKTSKQLRFSGLINHHIYDIADNFWDTDIVFFKDNIGVANFEKGVRSELKAAANLPKAEQAEVLKNLTKKFEGLGPIRMVEGKMTIGSYDQEKMLTNVVKNLKIKAAGAKKLTALQELMQRTGSGLDPVLAGRAVVEETGSLLKKPMTKTLSVLKNIFETRTPLSGAFWAAEAPLLILQGAYGRYANERDFRKALEETGQFDDETINMLGETYGQEMSDLGNVGLESYAVDQTDTSQIREGLKESGMSINEFVKMGGDVVGGVQDDRAAAKEIQRQRIKEAYENAIGRRTIEFKEGGRVSFSGGGFTRRGFLKLLAALGIGTAGAKSGAFLFSKAAGKKAAVKTGVDIATGTQGMPSWFPALVNKIIKEGDDVTEKLATMDRQVVHTKKLPDGEEVTVYRNLDSGDIRVDYDSIDNMGQEPISLQYTKGEEVYDTGKGYLSSRKTTKEPDRFGAAESEPSYVRTGPDDAEVQWQGTEYGTVDDLYSDTSRIKNYAEGKKPTMKDIVTRKRKTDEVNKINNSSEAQVDYSVNKFGEGPDYDDYLPDIDDID